MMQQCIRYASNWGYSTRRVLLTDMKNAVLISIPEDLKSVKYEWIDQDQVIIATALSVWMSINEFQKELEIADYKKKIEDLQKVNGDSRTINKYKKDMKTVQEYLTLMGDSNDK